MRKTKVQKYLAKLRAQQAARDGAASNAVAAAACQGVAKVGVSRRVPAYVVETFRVSLVMEPASYPLGEKVGNAGEVVPVARAILKTLDADKEHFVVLALSTKNRIHGYKLVSTGSLTGSTVHPREVARAAVGLCASAVVFVHNHPSGDPAPSPDDIDITVRLKKTADIIGIRALDHIILGGGRYFSFADRGML